MNDLLLKKTTKVTKNGRVIEKNMVYSYKNRRWYPASKELLNNVYNKAETFRNVSSDTIIKPVFRKKR